MDIFDHGVFLKGVGVDMSRISRFRKMKEDILLRLAGRILSQDELDFFLNSSDKPKRLTVYFCVKESVSKALGIGFDGISFNEIIMLYDIKKRPFIALEGKALIYAKKNNIKCVKVSVTHEGDSVIAFALAE